MLTSKIKTPHNLRIIVSDGFQYYVKVTVFDSNNRIVESHFLNRYEISFSLPQGLYTLRVEMNGEITDEVILLNKDKEYEIADEKYNSVGNRKIITPPKQFSSVLLGEAYSSSHEYYTHPATEWSKKDTNQLTAYKDLDCNSSLFIFLRFSSIEKYNFFKNTYTKPFFSDFEIIDENGEQIVLFEFQKGIETNEQHGWVAFNAKLPNGIYYLIYRGKESRQIPIYVFRDWHTQFFMTLGKEPLFGTTRIFLSKQREFDPYNETYKHIDILLSKLQNQDYSLDEQLIEMVAHRKYRSPMLGLICSYIYLKSKETNKDWLFRLITGNMQKVILKNNIESPDIRAMNILASEHFPTFKFKKTQVQGPPMFRIGFEAILKASVENKRLISQNSINDFISENLYYDSPYTTFKPIPFPEKPQEETGSFLETLKINLELSKPKKLALPHLAEINKLEKAFTKEKRIARKLQNDIKKSPVGDLEIFKIKNDFVKRKRISLPPKSLPKLDRFSTSINNLFDDSLINFIKSQTDVETMDSWLKVSISDMVKNDDDVSINDISNNIGVSGNTISRILNEWKKEAKQKHGK